MLRPSAMNEGIGRQSTLAQGGTSSSNKARMVAAKRKEYESTAALEYNSLKLKETFVTFRNQMQAAEKGADGVGRVLANWPQMFGIIASFAQGTASSSAAIDESRADQQTAASSSVVGDEEPPESLIRIELAKLDD